MSAIQNREAALSTPLIRHAAVESTPAKGWLGRYFDRIEERRLARERQEMEAYLSEAIDLADLEQRIRNWDRGLVRRKYGSFGF
ncbi:MAG TPA: DUF3563 family protein [Burkholderiaceae bacterium]